MYLIGYDIGSDTVKAALIDVNSHEVVGVTQYPEQDMDIIARQKGWAEQQPELWWRNVCLATKKLLATYHILAGDIEGIGIAYQMHGLVLIDRDLQVLRPAIIWCDSRAVSIGSQAFVDIGEEYCLHNYLNSPGNFTASKLKWVKDNEPTIYQKIYKILLPGDFIAMKLTGNVSTTISGLSEGVLWNFKEKNIAEKLLQYFEIDPELLPNILPTFYETGKITPSAAEQTGLAVGTPVTYRAGDQPNNAVSLNVLQGGEVAAISGTSGVVYGIVDQPLYDAQSRVNAFAHVNYENNFDRIGVLLCINGAGMQYSWVKHQIARGQTTYADMERMVSSVPVGSEGICILPFGNGAERIFNNRNLESHIYNLEFNRHTRAHVYRASLEGIAFTFVYGINMLKELGLEVDVIRVGNDNMFQSSVFSSTIATLLGTPIEVVDTNGAIGAARASGVGSGTYASLQEALKSIKASKIYEPNLNYASCSQAYNFWFASLNKVLNGLGSGAAFTKDLKLQNDNLKKELNSKNKVLSTQSLQLESQIKLIDELEDALRGLKKEVKSIEVRKKVNALIHHISNNKADSSTIEEYANLLNNDFIQRLKVQFPQLSFEELKMSLLLQMKLSTKEIASRLNLSTRGAETKRYRLRKKFDLDKRGSFDEFFRQI
ncbi:MAG: FGGY family carbohydrate kinase [Chitinophagales bacterium]